METIIESLRITIECLQIITICLKLSFSAGYVAAAYLIVVKYQHRFLESLRPHLESLNEKDGEQ